MQVQSELSYSENLAALQHSEFVQFRDFLYDTAGISLNDSKKMLVSGRLRKRIKQLGLSSYSEYFTLLANRHEMQERQTALDLLTTNETSFFREDSHFDFLQEHVFPTWGRGNKRVWSAASSSGEEAYTLAMTLDAHAPVRDWQIIGTDINTSVLEKARAGLYAIDRSERIPKQYLRDYCLKGVGSQEGSFIIDKRIRERVCFHHANLKSDLNKFGMFDVIFLRNVLIYFDLKTKQQVVSRLLQQLKPGGFLFVGRSESLNGVAEGLRPIVPSIYQKAR